MTSSYLERPLRTQAEVFRNLLAKVPETFIPVILYQDQLMLGEDCSLGDPLSPIVREIADGQYDTRDNDGVWETALVAVFRLTHDEKPENVSREAALAVLDLYIDDETLCTGADGYLREQPFLDEHLPDWRKSMRPGRVDREYEAEDAA